MIRSFYFTGNDYERLFYHNNKSCNEEPLRPEVQKSIHDCLWDCDELPDCSYVLYTNSELCYLHKKCQTKTNPEPASLFVKVSDGK